MESTKEVERECGDGHGKSDPVGHGRNLYSCRHVWDSGQSLES